MEKISFSKGIYNISNEEYHSSDGVSRSDLMLINKSPYHFYKEKEKKQEPTKAMKFGTAFHAYCLEPDLFIERFEVMKSFNKKTTQGKIDYKNFIEENKDKEFISEKDLLLIQNMYSSIKLNSDALNLIKNSSYELSLFWDDDDFNVKCKSRPDILKDNIICDLKSAASADPREFKREIFKNGLDVQAAMMIEGINKFSEKKIKDFAFIVVEKEYPYPVGVYFLSDDLLSIGYQKFKRLLNKYNDAVLSNKWGMYQTQMISI